VSLHGELPPFDPEQRFALYCDQMRLYRALKPYFVRGTFHGLGEHAHWHVLPGQPGGVLVLFNIGECEGDVRALVPWRLLGGATALPVDGADAHWVGDGVEVCCRLPAMSPRVVRIGAAACLSLASG
jgi:hypothetical protein